MKKILFPSLLILAFLVSCKSTKPFDGTPGVSLVPESDEPYITEGTIVCSLYSKDESDSLESSISYMFYDNANLPYHDSVNKIIKEYVQGYTSFEEETTGQYSDLTDQLVLESMVRFANEYNRQLESYDEDDFAGGIWITESTVEVIDENPDYVEVSFGNWSYLGGAHGNNVTEQRIIEKKTGRELKLSDFFTDLVELSSIAEVIFRADQEIPVNVSTEDAGFWFENDLFHLNENFVFNGESIDFLYNQYEIAPYAAGMIYLSIPMDKIQHLLKRKVD